MVTAVHGHSQSQWSHQCVAGFLGGNRVSNGKGSGLWTEEIERATGTLAHWTKRNSGSCYFASKVYQNVVLYRSSRCIFCDKTKWRNFISPPCWLNAGRELLTIVDGLPYSPKHGASGLT
ncbi:hypothetical protein EVAR_102634_1 [Eumeta japonica]|uniref:Uncharacterized protein n=1 Tax=Eumeta variegata TaxID=151549 RepID=A0A4C1TUT1_EUMVA|nr:hypothetical protein EVAR_102634_1 [Eumeta japonica]